MGRTVGELLDTVSYPELMKWGELYGIDPDPDWRADARAAQICAILANVNRDSKKRPQPYTIDDFMLKFGGAPQKAEAEAPKGAKIAPETIAWLFAKAKRQG